MRLETLIDSNLFELVNKGDDLDRDISKVFCCDLLSVAMGKAPADGAWVTVMANMNTLAVAALTDTSCIILAEGASLDDASVQKASDQGITVFATDLPVFEAALKVHGMLS